MVDVHGRDVHAATDATLHEIEMIGHVWTVLIVDVRAAFGNARDADAGHVAEHLVVDLRVATRALDEFGQPLKPGEADCGLDIRELSAVMRGQWIQPSNAFPELFLR